LPEIAFDAVTQPIGKTGIFYGSNSSFGILQDKLGAPDRAALSKRIDQIEALLAADAAGLPLDQAITPDGKTVNPDTVGNGILKPGEKFRLEDGNDILTQLNGQVNESGFNRFHTYHELSYPTTIGDVVTVKPRIGLGFTNYSNISGPTPLNASRPIFAAGLETSTKFSKTYDDAVIPSLGLNGIRHIVQPYLNWSYVNTDDQGKEFYGIDRLVRSTEIRSLDVNNFTAIDSLASWNVFRMGVYNRFQTKRNGTTLNWLETNTFMDAYVEDPEGDRTVSNLFNEIKFEPVRWMRLNLGSQIPVSTGENSFSQVNTRVTFMPRRDIEFSLGHRFLQDHPYFQDSSLFDVQGYYRINDTWGFSFYERFEADDSTLEMQQYSIHRDLASWAMSLGAVVRDNRGETEYGLVFSMTLKEFPGVRIPIDYDPTGNNR
jgi:LPS-assembly protein